MAGQILEVQVQGDFLERLTSARPVQAVAELIWNAVDGDANSIDVTIESNRLGITSVVVTDDGEGIPFSEVSTLFTNLGGSWKRLSGQTKTKHRMLHGEEGKGRFRVLALGRIVDWIVTVKGPSGDLDRYKITIERDSPRRVTISELKKAPKGSRVGVEVRVSELFKQWQLESEAALQELAEIFALYLTEYTDVSISVQGKKVDPSSQIIERQEFDLPSFEDDKQTYSCRLELIEWRLPTDRILYLCNERGVPLHRIAPGIHAPGFNFSAYLKSSYVSHLNERGLIGLSEMDPHMLALIENAKEVMRTHFKARSAQVAHNLVEEWKSEQTYPYVGDASNPVQRLERQVFESVALNVAKSLPDFQSADRTNRKFQLRMLRQAIEKSPAELQLILTEVLELPPRKQEELVKLLKRTPLSSIIGAAKMVGDRLDFLDGLESLLFDAESKKQLRERSQLHRILADNNTWIFGEEFALTVDDQTLTEVLRKHAKLAKLDLVINEPVKRVDGTKGIVDLMLSRKIPGPRADELDHLVVELKAPKVKLGAAETTQIQSYAFAVAHDERFRDLNTRWTFWLVSNDMDEFVKKQVRSSGRPVGMLWQSEDSRITIWVRTWSQIIHDSRARLRVFQKELNYTADRDASVDYVKEIYARILSGENFDDDDVQELAPADGAAVH